MNTFQKKYSSSIVASRSYIHNNNKYSLKTDKNDVTCHVYQWRSRIFANPQNIGESRIIKIVLSGLKFFETFLLSFLFG